MHDYDVKVEIRERERRKYAKSFTAPPLTELYHVTFILFDYYDIYITNMNIFVEYSLFEMLRSRSILHFCFLDFEYSYTYNEIIGGETQVQT